MDRDDNDEALMLKYRQGDAGAFEALYRRHKGGVYRYVLRQCRNEAVAEELFQDIWMKVIDARGRYEATAKFTTWLYRIAHNRVVDYARRQFTSASTDASNDSHTINGLAAPHQSQPEQRLAMQSTGTRLLSLIEQLPAEQRQAFLLREEAGMSLKEIATTLGVKPETAKSRLRYAVDKLRAGMDE